MSEQRKPDEAGDVDSLIDDVLREMAGGDAPPWLAARVSARISALPSPASQTAGRKELSVWWWRPRLAGIAAAVAAVAILAAIALTLVYGPEAGRQSSDAPAIAARSLEAEPMVLLPEAPRPSPVAREPREPARSRVPAAGPGPRVVARSSEEARRHGTGPERIRPSGLYSCSTQRAFPVDAGRLTCC